MAIPVPLQVQQIISNESNTLASNMKDQISEFSKHVVSMATSALRERVDDLEEKLKELNELNLLNQKTIQKYHSTINEQAKTIVSLGSMNILHTGRIEILEHDVDAVQHCYRKYTGDYCAHVLDEVQYDSNTRRIIKEDE